MKRPSPKKKKKKKRALTRHVGALKEKMTSSIFH